MKKPRNTIGLFAFVMIVLGTIYFALGLIVMNNEMHATEDVKESGQLLVFGAIFLMVGLYAYYKNKKKLRTLDSLHETGVRLSGSVVDVAILKHMHWGTLNPCVVKYSFEYLGAVRNAKSELLWEMPVVYPNDVITVLVDKADPRISKPIVLASEIEKEKKYAEILDGEI